MIAANDEGPISLFFKGVAIIIASPILIPIWAAKAAGRRKAAEAERQQVVPPTTPSWVPRTREERAVLAALILGNRPLTNAELAELMQVSPAEASKRVTAIGDGLRRERIGREVRISLN